MSKTIDLTGQSFHSWTVIGKAQSNNGTYWNCKCQCGKISIIRGGALRSGQSKSCGSINKIDLVGKRFGKWIVLNQHKSTAKGHSRWLCKCDCGTIKIVTGSNLQNNQTISCGACKNHELSQVRDLVN